MQTYSDRLALLRENAWVDAGDWRSLAEVVAGDAALDRPERAAILLDMADALVAIFGVEGSKSLVRHILDRCISVWPDNSSGEASFRLADKLLGCGAHAEALAHYRAYFAQPPTDRAEAAVAHDGLATCLWFLDRRAEALDQFEAAVDDAVSTDFNGALRATICRDMIKAAIGSGRAERATLAALILLSSRADDCGIAVEDILADVTQVIGEVALRGRPSDAADLAVEAWKFSRRSAGASPELQTQILCLLGTMHQAAGRHRRARGALEVATTQLQSLTLDVSDLLDRSRTALLACLESDGDRPRAAVVAGEIAAARAAKLGETAPATLRAQAEQARHLFAIGDRKRAAALQRKITTSGRGRLEDIEIGAMLLDLAKTLIDEGELPEARAALDEASSILSIAGTSRELRNLHYLQALHLRHRHLPKEALPILKLAIQETEEAFGKTSGKLATPLQLLGILYNAIGDRPAARAAYERASKLNDLPATEIPKILHNLANIERLEGRLALARVAFEDALAKKKKAGLAPGSIAATLVNLGAVYRDLGKREQAIDLLREALALETRVFGAASGDVRDTRNNLAGALAGEGKIDEALCELSLVLETQSDRLRDLVALGLSDRQRLDALAATELELQAYISLAAQRMGSDASLVATAYRHVIARKGLATEAYYRSRYAAVSGDELSMPSDVADKLPRRLPARTTLVDFIEYGRARLDTGPDPAIEVPRAPQVGAFVIGPGEPIRFVDLGAAASLYAKVDACWTAIADRLPFHEVKALSRSLAEALWDPLSLEPGRFDHLIFSPDGKLDRVSFAALILAEGTWLADSCSISYVASGRELIQDRLSDCQPTSEPAVFAAPYYGPRDMPVWRHLEGSAIEGSHVADICGVQAHMAERASAEALKSVVRPKYLHIASHGIYCEHGAASGPNPHPILARLASNADPMQRSALFMAIGDADKARAGDAAAAGIVTAADLLRLDLRGTELVVLSACYTGHGDPVPLDGTHGLRRALRAAGAANVISSFWPVDDRTAPTLMRAMYAALARGAEPREALSEASRLMRAQLREPRHWAAFFVHGALT